MPEYTIVARGEMSLEQRDIILRYLGRQGLSTEAVIANAPEEESRLGYATSEEVDAFAESHGISKKTATRTWRGLARWEGVIGRLNKGKGLGLFDEFSSSLNLDCLEFVLASGLTAAIPNFGPKMEQFSQNFIDSRRQQPETQETGEEGAGE